MARALQIIPVVKTTMTRILTATATIKSKDSEDSKIQTAVLSSQISQLINLEQIRNMK